MRENSLRCGQCFRCCRVCSKRGDGRECPEYGLHPSCAKPPWHHLFGVAKAKLAPIKPPKTAFMLRTPVAPRSLACALAFVIELVCLPPSTRVSTMPRPADERRARHER